MVGSHAAYGASYPWQRDRDGNAKADINDLGLYRLATTSAQVKVTLNIVYYLLSLRDARSGGRRTPIPGNQARWDKEESKKYGGSTALF